MLTARRGTSTWPIDAVREGVGEVAEIETDAIGNLVARTHGTGDGPLLALFAHLDVIGLAVAHVPDDALIPVHTLGSWRPAIAYGQRVEIARANGVGARCDRAPDEGRREGRVGPALRRHRRTRRRGGPLARRARRSDRRRRSAASSSPADASRRAASTTAPGVYVALEALRRLAAEGVAADVAVVAGAQEELGAAGARGCGASAAARRRRSRST